jgi:hypothetical protein
VRAPHEDGLEASLKQGVVILNTPRGVSPLRQLRLQAGGRENIRSKALLDGEPGCGKQLKKLSSIYRQRIR